MAIDNPIYLEFDEAVWLHFELKQLPKSVCGQKRKATRVSV